MRPAVLLVLFAAALAPRSFAAANIQIVSEDQADRAWVRSNQLPPPAWPSLDSGVGAACVNLAYWIDKEGATADPIVLRAWAPGVPDTPDGLRQLGAFSQSAALTLAGWRYRPAEGNSKSRPLITNAVFLFARDAGEDLQALRQQCLVGDLRDFIYRKTEAGYRRGNLNKGLIDRRREQIPYEIPEGCVRHDGWCE